MMGFCILGKKWFAWILLSKSRKYIFLALGMGESNSLVKHSTADREVGGSIALASFFIIIVYLSKDFRRLKD